MAELQDLESEASELEVVEQQDAAAQEATPVAETIPDEFKGMGIAELARIAQHARKEMGRQGNELGEIRKLADELIKSQLKKPEPEPVKEVDFFENPQEAIRRAVETNPRVLAAEQYGMQAQQAQARQVLSQLHPDYQTLVADEEFKAFIGNNRIRQQLLKQADGYDVEAAHELFSTFKQLKAVKAKPEVSEVEKSARTSAMQAASVDTGGSGESSKKVYRRADLIRLKMRDPSKYEDMQEDIMLAYQQGRVK